MADTPPKLPPKPKITLHIPTNQASSPGSGNQQSPITTNSIHINPLYVPNYNNNFNNMQPMTPVTAMPQSNPYLNPFINPGKASEYMFKQFEGFKDFTMNTAKSGLSVGEKSAFWMYNKLSTWSKKWFTHLMLTMLMMGYTAIGAFIFMTVEGRHETKVKTDLRAKRYEFVTEMHGLINNGTALLEDPELWKGKAIDKLLSYEETFKEIIEEGKIAENKTVWTFSNAVFYCGTIYTTIGK